MKKIYEDLLDDIEAKSSHSSSLSDDEYVLDFDDATRWTHLILMKYPIEFALEQKLYGHTLTAL